MAKQIPATVALPFPNGRKLDVPTGLFIVSAGQELEPRIIIIILALRITNLFLPLMVPRLSKLF